MFSFTELLDGDDRGLIEDQMFRSIRSRLRELDKHSPYFTEEQDLINAIKPLCSDELIAVVNSLSKASYAASQIGLCRHYRKHCQNECLYGSLRELDFQANGAVDIESRTRRSNC